MTSPSIAGFPGIPFSFGLFLPFVDRPGGLRGTDYWSELDKSTELVCRGTSASRPCNRALMQLQQFTKQFRRIVDVRVIEKITTPEQSHLPEPHVALSDNDAEMYARNSENCNNEQLDPSAIEQDTWKDLHAVHRGAVATAPVTLSVMWSPAAAIAVDGAPRVGVVGERGLQLPRRPQLLFSLLR
ncbi:hypothetical protein MRX96_027046 [Rhipicephalus microplus]|uniref:Uncharacterized protein n=1 Tax=Rhipicephalus microplus TaxID=6941 RepID=A0A9J6D145_RHIMP|nr:hypothetical protein HPB51_027141 [Rhipicephalus microplus]